MREGTFAEFEQAVPLLRQWGVRVAECKGVPTRVRGTLKMTVPGDTETRNPLWFTVPFRQYTAEVRYLGFRKKRRIIVNACADDALRVP